MNATFEIKGNNILLTTFEGNEIMYKVNSCYTQVADRFQLENNYHVKFLKERIECPYYKGKHRCGIQYLGYKEFASLHPYYQFYEKLIPIDSKTYSEILKHIKG